MSTSRRQFLQYSVAAASMLTLSKAAEAAAPKSSKDKDSRAAAPKKLLVLGGTGFLGPAVVNAARARGHTVTLFNRGKTRPELFPDVEKLHGDRDPKKGEGLKALEGRSFDAVIDDCGYFPRMVKASTELLAPHVKHYVFISSVSAYANDKTPNEDESAPTAKLADPTVETMGKDFEFYGGLKRLCEEAAEAAMPGRVTNVRPGYIVGPEDRSDRFTYWPVRFDQGGEMIAPGNPSDPLQVIDVRDLAEWLVHVVENNLTGVYNAVGPAQPWSIGGVIDACRQVTGKDTKVTWVPAEFLEKNGEKGDVTLPIWMPPTGDTKGAHLRSNAKAVKAGLKFRPTVDTVRDTLAWFKDQPQERRDKFHAGLTRKREEELLALWHAEGQKAASGSGK